MAVQTSRSDSVLFRDVPQRHILYQRTIDGNQFWMLADCAGLGHVERLTCHFSVTAANCGVTVRKKMSHLHRKQRNCDQV
jgi:hypothetical protein